MPRTGGRLLFTRERAVGVQQALKYAMEVKSKKGSDLDEDKVEKGKKREKVAFSGPKSRKEERGIVVGNVEVFSGPKCRKEERGIVVDDVEGKRKGPARLKQAEMEVEQDEMDVGQEVPGPSEMPDDVEQSVERPSERMARDMEHWLAAYVGVFGLTDLDAQSLAQRYGLICECVVFMIL